MSVKWLGVAAIRSSVLSNVTPRCSGSEQKGMVSLLLLTFNETMIFLLRWKTADTVFVVLSFSFHVWRYLPKGYYNQGLQINKKGTICYSVPYFMGHFRR